MHRVLPRTLYHSALRQTMTGILWLASKQLNQRLKQGRPPTSYQEGHHFLHRLHGTVHLAASGCMQGFRGRLWT